MFWGIYSVVFILVIGLLWAVFALTRRNCANKDISLYYLNTAAREPKRAWKSIDSFFNIAGSILLDFIAILIVEAVIIGVSFTGENNAWGNFIVHIEWDEWFNTLIVGISIPIMIATIAATYLFQNAGKNYYVFFSVNDLLESWKLQKTLFIGFILQLVGAATTLGFYVSFYSAEEFSHEHALFFALMATIMLLWSIFQYTIVLWHTVRFSISEVSAHSLLNRVYIRVRKWPRERNEKLTDSNLYWIEQNLNYLLSKIATADVSKHAIKFKPFLLKDNVSKRAQAKSISLFAAIVSIVSIMLSLAIISYSDYIFLNVVSQNLWINITCILLGIAIVVCVYKYSTSFYQMVTVITMGSWGFSLSDDTEIYFSSENRRLFNRKFSELFRSYYCVISAFRDILLASPRVINRALDIIFEHISCHPKDVLIYTACLFLYYDHLECNKKSQLQDRLETLRRFLRKNEIDSQILEANTSALLFDILRINPQQKVHGMFAQINQKNQSKH